MNIRLTATALLVGLGLADTHAQSQTAAGCMVSSQHETQGLQRGEAAVE